MKALRTWLDQHGYELLQCERIPGGFAAELYMLTYQGLGNGGPAHRQRQLGRPTTRAIYKKLAPGRDSEIMFYDHILGALPVAVPTLIAIVQETDGKGLLLEYGGEVLKRYFEQCSPMQKQHILADLVGLLANLHAATKLQAADWLSTQAILPYPYASSLEWAQTALQELATLQQEQAAGVTVEIITEIGHIMQGFYPRYADWTEGRTTLTHGDPHMENILCQDGGYQLIDWEWARISMPQRDLAILLQDVHDDALHAFAWKQYQAVMQQSGWDSGSERFQQAFYACMVDNSLMMLGWEIKKYRAGHVSSDEIKRLVSLKLRWIREYYDRLMHT